MRSVRHGSKSISCHSDKRRLRPHSAGNVIKALDALPELRQIVVLPWCYQGILGATNKIQSIEFPWLHPVNTKHLYNICTMLGQRQRRWADVVQMLNTCFAFVE